MQAATLTTGQILDELLLIRALEVETANIAARGNLVVADANHVLPVRNLLPHGLVAIQIVAVLIHAGYLHGFAQHDFTGIRLLLTGNHAEQGGFTGTVTADDADNRALGHA